MEQAPASTKRQRVPGHAFKWVKRIALCLILGAVVNVGVAWGGHHFFKGPYDRAGVLSPEWPVEVPNGWPQPLHANSYAHGIVRKDSYSAYEQEPTIEYLTSSLRLHYWTHNLVLFRVGWPLPSMRYWTTDPPVDGSQHASKPQSHRLFRGYPNSPIPIGFTVNTLFYGAILFGPLFGVGVLKRRRRMKRGLCVWCAYDMAGLSVCPECGREK